MEVLRKDLGITQEDCLLKNIKECLNHLQFINDLKAVEELESKE